MDDSLLDTSIYDVEGSSDFEPAVKPVRVSLPQLSGGARLTSSKKAKAAKAAAPKKTTAAKPKTTTTKAVAPKKTVQSKLKMSTTTKSVPKKRKTNDSDEENSDLDHDSFNDDSLLSNDTPPAKKPKTTGVKKSSGKALAEIENESFMQSAEKPKAKGAGGDSDKYQKITHIEHILLRPDTYIGSIEFQESEMWVYNSETDAMEHRKVNYVPGLYKIFDEVLVNAADNKQNDKNMDEIKVTVDRESGEISVWNNGRGIPIEIHKVRQHAVFEVMHLLTRTTGGGNLRP